MVEERKIEIAVLRLLLSGTEDGGKVSLCAGEAFSVGRASGNSLVLNDSNVSRHHALLTASTSGVVLSDLSSLNGTFVNGRRISTPENVSSGDTIEVGKTKIVVELSHREQEDELSVQQTQSAELRTVTVTVLVADVSGYTKLSESLPPADVAKMLDAWFGLVADIIREQGGEIDKCIGDCVMALWRSAPQDAEDVSRRTIQAVTAAREIVRRTTVLSGVEWVHQQFYPWCCRVALNTGEALMGTVGRKEVRDFTVLGDSVNTAFRLEQVAARLGCDVVFSAATASQLPKSVSLKNLGYVELEGRRERVEAFTLA